jgi:RimJ/RimL family protein N-acetyltransferase
LNDHNQTSNALSTITLRPVVAADEPLLLEIYASTRAEEMAMVPWTREQQEEFVRMQFAAQQEQYKKLQPDASHDIIMFKDRPVGRLYVARTEERIEIMDITLLPQDRNSGIGTSLIKALMAEAARSMSRVLILLLGCLNDWVSKPWRKRVSSCLWSGFQTVNRHCRDHRRGMTITRPSEAALHSN